MNDCPFLKHCQHPKTEQIKIIGITPEKIIKVCDKCPLLFQTKKNVFNKKQNDCLYCGSKLEDIVVSQKVGCAFCYIFIKELASIVINSQNNNTFHLGKKSKNLLLHFFKQLIEDEKKELPEDEKICDRMEEIISDLF